MIGLPRIFCFCYISFFLCSILCSHFLFIQHNKQQNLSVVILFSIVNYCKKTKMDKHLKINKDTKEKVQKIKAKMKRKDLVCDACWEGKGPVGFNEKYF